ncbi:response regulator of the LytR/AlgR family [Desulfosporosinus orientis DSM 765]|uniref:Stage 0 sporulation protein A homolog n=1 Tax=Desulfosporosinus orientis (strain ATCC 19365 / DSM 765 / NCIMB 8382 / VKM B-1628 / Singapore I) TaxID=768706 RepID=G7WD64_DESOD|nr:response regulator [Desulfosporosinus orientis]AET67549.1 response regulator of the LytR/AlgR family [Desulfosporosinus orientis DSM 765]
MLNISICDDGALQRALVVLLIHEYESKFGVKFNLYQFSSGEELLEKFNEDRNLFDLYFLDNRMKKITGLEIASYIRQRNKDCYIVFITASGPQDDFKVVSPLRVLIKPAQQEDITKILDKVLEGRIGRSPIR